MSIFGFSVLFYYSALVSMNQYHPVSNYIDFIIYTLTIIYSVISYIVRVVSPLNLIHCAPFPGCL